MIWGYTGEESRLTPYLENIVERSSGRLTVDGLKRDIQEKEKQVYVIGDWQAICLTSLHENHINIHACVGERAEEWRDALDDFLREWARATGKQRIIGLVRPGWARWAKMRGYKETHRELVVEV